MTRGPTVPEGGERRRRAPLLNVEKRCPTCGTSFAPRREGQTYCTRNCGRWKHHTAIQQRLSRRPPADADEAYLAGLIASDGYIENRKGREAPTGLSIKMAAEAKGLLSSIAARFGRRLYERSNGQFVVSFIEVPVVWKLELPSLTGELEPHYFRGLLDGDGCWSGAFSAGRFYPYVSLAFNPLLQQWIADAYMGYLGRNDVGFRRSVDKATVHQVRSWSAEARKVARLVYCVPGLVHERKHALAMHALSGSRLRPRFGP